MLLFLFLDEIMDGFIVRSVDLGDSQWQRFNCLQVLQQLSKRLCRQIQTKHFVNFRRDFILRNVFLLRNSDIVSDGRRLIVDDMQILMVSQRRLPPERPPAVRAWEGPFAGMYAVMTAQVVSAREVAAADGALELRWGLSRNELCVGRAAAIATVVMLFGHFSFGAAVGYGSVVYGSGAMGMKGTGCFVGVHGTR